MRNRGIYCIWFPPVLQGVHSYSVKARLAAPAPKYVRMFCYVVHVCHFHLGPDS